MCGLGGYHRSFGTDKTPSRRNEQGKDPHFHCREILKSHIYYENVRALECLIRRKKYRDELLTNNRATELGKSLAGRGREILIGRAKCGRRKRGIEKLLAVLIHKDTCNKQRQDVASPTVS
jgi:hypothetical protein